jgi:hypothetical protein
MKMVPSNYALQRTVDAPARRAPARLLSCAEARRVPLSRGR